MADRYWVNDDNDTNWHNANNWSAASGGAGGAGIPTSSDAVILDGNYANPGACMPTAAWACASLTALAGFDQHFDANGQAGSLAGSFVYDGTGNMTIDGGMTITGDGDLHVGSGVATALLNSTIDLQGNGSIDIDETNLKASKIICAAAGKKTTWDSSAGFAGAANWEWGAGEMAIDSLTAPLYIATTSTLNPWVINASCTTTGNGSIKYRSASPFAGGVTHNVPAFNSSGINYALAAAATGLAIFSLQGAVSAGVVTLLATSTGAIRVDTNGEDITAAVRLTLGTQNPGGEFDMNCGASTFDIVDLDLTSKNAGPNRIAAQSSIWYISGDLTLGTNTAWTAGSSKMYLDGADATDITTEDETLGTVVVDKTANGVTLQDDLDCKRFVVRQGTWNLNGNTITESDPDDPTFDKATGAIAETVTLTIEEGWAVGACTVVDENGVSWDNVTVVDPNTVTADVPAAGEGTGAVKLTLANAAGFSVDSAAGAFTYPVAPASGSTPSRVPPTGPGGPRPYRHDYSIHSGSSSPATPGLTHNPGAIGATNIRQYPSPIVK